MNRLLNRPLRTPDEVQEQVDALLDIAQTLADGQRNGRQPEALRRTVLARLSRWQLEQFALLLVGVAADAFEREPETDHRACDIDPCPLCATPAGRRTRDRHVVRDWEPQVDEVLVRRATRGWPLPLEPDQRREAVTVLESAGYSDQQVADVLKVTVEVLRADRQKEKKAKAATGQGEAA